MKTQRIPRASFLAGGALAALNASTPAGVWAASPFVNVAYAGSLITLMERSIGPEFSKSGTEFRGTARGSVAIANQIRDGLLQPDVFISADAKAIEALMKLPAAPVTWYATFASTRMVIGYAPNSTFARSFVEAARGTRPIAQALLQPGLRLGRTDPTLDPKGYRTLASARLLEKESGISGFAQRLLGEDRNPDQILPEETLITRLEAGELDAAFLYATESVSRRIPAVELPRSANLGESIAYALSILQNAQNRLGAAAFVTYLLSSAGRERLKAAGLRVLAPRIAGARADVPPALGPLLF